MSPVPALPLDTLAQQLTALGLEHAASALPEPVETAARERLDPSAFLGRVLTRQLARKDERPIATMLTLSGLPGGKTLESVDWGFQPKVDRRQLEARATCSFVRERQNVLFLGPPGVGKSHRSCGLGVKAIKNGFSVMHTVLDDLLHALKADAAIPPARRKAKRYLDSALLIIDEVGFRPLDRMEANLFFRPVSARSERGSVVVTTNKHVRDWPEVFAGDEILTTVILDRLLHHVHIVHIDGRSYRPRELDRLLTPPPVPPNPVTPEASSQPPASPWVRTTG
jgi:DNA replication protein DnaC